MQHKLFVVLFDLFKPIQTFFITLSGLVSYIVASHGNLNAEIFALLFISLYCSIAGTTGLNMYLDKDLDSVMERTKNRALPSGKIEGSFALGISVLTLLAGLFISSLINFWVFAAAVLGSFVDIVIYTYTLKRKTVLNVVLGSIAGGAPSLGGWAAYKGQIEIPAFMLMLIVSLWSLVHIWHIASYFKEDYIRAKVPMLPLIVGETKAGIISVLIIILILNLCLLLFLEGYLILPSLFVIVAYTAILIFYEARFIKTKDRKLSKVIYKMLTGYLGIIIVMLMLSAFLTS